MGQNAKATCVQTFPGQKLQGWESTTVGALRTYHYGPPNFPSPLATAFPGLADTVAATWCVVLTGPAASSLFGIVAGQSPRRALTVNGPGVGGYLGEMKYPPEPP